MSLDIKINDLAVQLAADVKALRTAQGVLSSLPTTAKGNLVAAITELYGLLGSAGAVIDDNAGDGSTAVTWSANKIYDTIELAKAAVKSDIIGGASAAYDTLLELQELATGNASTGAALATAINNRVRFDAPQTLTTAEKLQACQNIGIGDPETDFVAIYNAAKV